MILTKDSNDNWSTVAAGAGTWKGTKAAWEAGVSGGTIPANTVGLITDDAENFDVVDTVADGNMHAVTSNAVYDAIQDSRELDYSNTTHLTVDTTNKTFTADGIFIFSDFYISSSNSPYFEFYIEDVCVQISNVPGANIRASSGTFPVRSGMKYKYALGGTGTIASHSGTFIPYKV